MKLNLDKPKSNEQLPDPTEEGKSLANKLAKLKKEGKATFIDAYRVECEGFGPYAHLTFNTNLKGLVESIGVERIDGTIYSLVWGRQGWLRSMGGAPENFPEDEDNGPWQEKMF